LIESIIEELMGKGGKLVRIFKASGRARACQEPRLTGSTSNYAYLCNATQSALCQQNID